MRGTLQPFVTMSLVFISLVALTDAASAGDPYGNWVRPSTGTQVRFYNCGGKLCGKIVAVKEEARTKEIGVMILNGALKSGANKWQGDMLDAGTGKVYSGVVISLDDANVLSVKGCVMVICRTERWSRVR